jgi:ATP-dependent Clp protease ATP-binding subunit ClpC
MGAHAALNDLGCDRAALRAQVIAAKPAGQSATPAMDLPFAARAKRVVEQSMVEARERDHSYTDTEHLLLAVLREEEGLGGRVLRNAA